MARAIAAVAPAPIIWLDREGHIVFCNDSARRTLGYSAEEVIGQSVLISLEVREGGAPFEKNNTESGESNWQSAVMLCKNGVEVKVKLAAYSVRAFDEQCRLCIISDSTSYKQCHGVNEHLNSSLNIMRGINNLLISCTEEDCLLANSCKILAKYRQDCTVAVFVIDDNRKITMRQTATFGDHSELATNIDALCDNNDCELCPVSTAIRTARPIVVGHGVVPLCCPVRGRSAQEHTFRSVMAVPLTSGGRCYGALALHSGEADTFNEEEQRLLSEFADVLAFGISTLRHRVEAAARERHLGDLIDYNPDAILALDAEGNILFSNRAAETLLGQSREQLQGTPLGLPATTEEFAEIEVLSRRDDGGREPRIVEFRGLRISSLQEAKTVAFLHDITEKKKAAQLATRMGCILEHSWNEIYVFASDTLRFLDVSAGGILNLGYSLEELRQMTPVEIYPGFTQEQFEILLQPLRTETRGEILFEAEQQRKGGTRYPVEVRLQLSKEGETLVFIAIVQDISERKRYIAELEHKALYDEVTDLPNRALLLDRFDQALKRASREEVNLAVLVMELLHLTEMRHLVGYEKADSVLQMVASRLQQSTRESDIVARISDKVFAVVIVNATQNVAQLIAKKIQKHVELPIEVDGSPLEVEAILGIAFFPEHGGNVDMLLRRAEIAMRAAEIDGSGISTYTQEPNPLGRKWLRLHVELRRALEDRALAVHYQPKVNINMGRIVGVEALARWPHPREGMISPADFIPLVERSGLIRPFTLWVLEESIKQLHDWMTEGINISIAVNLSTRNLLDTSLPETIAHLTDSYHVPVSSLCLEITESAIMDRREQALEVVNRLHELGAILSIDDFGTGYSSLAYLKELPLDELKLDQSFISGLLKNTGDALIVRSTIDLAHSLGLKTVAEGVENKEILDRLALLNCDIAQGYYLGRPLSKEGMCQWLQNSPFGIRSFDK